jgi:hypothetical protein
MPLRRDVPNEREGGRLRQRALLAVKVAAEPAIADEAHRGVPAVGRSGEMTTLVSERTCAGQVSRVFPQQADHVRGRLHGAAPVPY